MHNFPIVISGPSGVGKSTIIKNLLKSNSNLWLSVSCNTRKARPGEEEGVDYFFISKEDFIKKINTDEFFEWVQVYNTYKGTPKKPLFEKLSKGITPILELEHIGAFALKKEIPDSLLIYILPPTLEEQQKRLLGRPDPHMSKEELQLREQAVENEISMSKKYDVVIVNENIDETVKKIKDLIAVY